MNKFITAIKALDTEKVETLLQKEPKWATWQEEDGKNALHYLGGVVTGSDDIKEGTTLHIFQFLLQQSMDINAVHRINDRDCIFPATPLWYAYTRGRNKALYTWILEQGADPNNCMFAIAWYDDVEAATLFKKHGADIEQKAGRDTPFLGAFNWKRYAIAEWFLQNGADVNTARDGGNTALHYAVKRKLKAEHIQFLLKYGADPNRFNDGGLSPKNIAEQNRQRNILSIFNTYQK